MSRIAGTAEESRERVAAAGVRSWPVVIRAVVTERAIGITTAHHRADGATGAYMSVGGRVQIDDQTIDTPDGPVRVGGIASAILDAFSMVALRKVA